jgi:N-glycosidase YbiA
VGFDDANDHSGGPRPTTGIRGVAGRPGSKGGEIVGGTTPIDEFDGNYAFLSNFYPAPAAFEGIIFPTSEHAFQAAKSLNLAVRRQVALLKTPGAAKRFGRNINLRPGWDGKRIEIMERILRDKFSRPNMRHLLLATHPRPLIEGNWWNDTFWGVCRGKGENHLGQLLMKLREEWK